MFGFVGQPPPGNRQFDIAGCIWFVVVLFAVVVGLYLYWGGFQ